MLVYGLEVKFLTEFVKIFSQINICRFYSAFKIKSFTNICISIDGSYQVSVHLAEGF
jgi:hypothetical protein